MLEKLKKQAMAQGMKLMSNPKFMKLMADPRLMTAITQTMALRGRIQSEIDGKLRSLACAFNLATRQEVESLQRELSRMESRMATLKKQAERSQNGQS